MQTISGAISSGAPNSPARFASEAAHAIENAYQLLLLTDEGRELLRRFFRSVGSDFDSMPPDVVSVEIVRESKALFSFLCGVTFMFSKL